MKRLTATTLIALGVILAAGCSQEPSTDTTDTSSETTIASTTDTSTTDVATWDEYAGCIYGISAEKTKALLRNSSSAITDQTAARWSLIHRAQATEECAELRPTLTTDE
jgi:hypothetical protein